MKIEFFMPMIPPTVTHQEKRIAVVNGKSRVYEDERLKEARSKLMANLASYVPGKEIEGAIALSTIWLFPFNTKHKVREPKITKPDTDNLQKLLKDCMTELKFWKDDAQVFFEQIEKWYNDVPGIFIMIESVGDVDD